MTPGVQRLAVALDCPDSATALALADALRGAVGILKVGLELFTAEGPAVARAVAARGELFLDLKLHDIPNTVEGAARSAAALGARYLTVHAAGGEAMLQAAVRGAGLSVRVLAVTVLTSLGPQDLQRMGLQGDPAAAAVRLAKLALGAGVAGLVCSPAEVAEVRREAGPKAILVVPGIRPGDSATNDQQRVGTPADAIRAGADVLVVGRPIREAPDPRAAALSIAAEIARALPRGD